MFLFRAAVVVGVAAVVFVATGSVASDNLQQAGSPQISGEVNPGVGDKPSLDAGGRAVYIVQFEHPPLATYDGGIGGFDGTSRKATGSRRLDTKSFAATSYVKFLQAEQKAFIQGMAAHYKSAKPAVRFTYQHAFNGVAMEMTPKQAAAAAKMPGVVRVTREKFYMPNTDAGPAWIDAPSIWSGPPNNVPHSQGEGMVIGVLDTGINHDHPSFADIGSDGFDHTNPLGSGTYIPGSYCDTTDPSFCNDKLIGAWSFVPGDPNFPVPEASDGHGVHTASTAGGNFVDNATIVAPTTNFVRDVSGVAPHANIIAYDVCVTSCPGSALLAAVNQVVIDSSNLPNGIAAINYSISGGSNPYGDSIELGFLAATDAGVFVSASAGNSGPTAGTVAHLSPWVTTVAASTHNRTIVNNLVDLNSAGGSIADISGLGLTSGYGPAPIINSADLEGAFPGSTLCGLGGLGSFISPWPAGFFTNGEIVACTRGVFGRVEKGANVLFSGGSGYVLMDNGGGVVGDAHVLPGIHISQADAAILGPWLTLNAGTATARITGFSLDLSASNGDIMAGFSSRGPNSAFDVIKPDVTAPGVSVMAGFADPAGCTSSCGSVDNSFGFLSGTSMSSPHNAGSAALLTAVKPNWSPHQIKSALMLTSTNADTLKEDGVTPTDHFDLGAGRVDLSRAQEVGLTLDETTANFLAADPSLGGDPKTLNVPSMADGTCVGTCSWTRTVTSDNGHTTHWDLSTSGPAGLDLSVSNSTGSGKRLKLKAGESATITVTADTIGAPSGWNFAELNFDRKGDGPDLHMPIAVRPALSSDANLLNKSVSSASASPGDILTYVISITNGPLTGTINLSDVVPAGTTFVSGSESEVITNGATISPWSYNAGTNTLSWSGTLNASGLFVAPSPAPFGYFPLALIGVPPFALPSNCDDGGFILNVPAYTYNGATQTQTIWSVNGTLEAGIASLLAASASNQNLPSPVPPNNLMAPNWTDLNLCTGGNWKVAVLNFIFPSQFTVYEWDNVPLFGDLSRRYSFQIWVENNVSGAPNIWFTYGLVSAPLPNLTVGVEDAAGAAGASRYFNGTGTPPAPGVDLQVMNPVGGTATLSFDAEATCSVSPIVNRANLTSGSVSETAIAFSTCP